MEESTPKKKGGAKKKPKTPSPWDNEELNEIPTRIWSAYSMGGARTWGKYTPSTWPDGTPAEWTPGD
eukprot:SAG11_NODE_12586_length_694_cov_357.469799_2_plen_66_part_01